MTDEGMLAYIVQLENMFTKADAENARLREALQMIADEAWHSNDGTRAEYCHPEGCESPGIARAALAGEEEKG